MTVRRRWRRSRRRECATPSYVCARCAFSFCLRAIGNVKNTRCVLIYERIHNLCRYNTYTNTRLVASQPSSTCHLRVCLLIVSADHNMPGVHAALYAITLIIMACVRVRVYVHITSRVNKRVLALWIWWRISLHSIVRDRFCECAACSEK